MRTALTKGGVNLASLHIPIEGIFHLVTVMKILAVGDDLWSINLYMVLTKDFF